MMQDENSREQHITGGCVEPQKPLQILTCQKSVHIFCELDQKKRAFSYVKPKSEMSAATILSPVISPPSYSCNCNYACISGDEYDNLKSLFFVSLLL